MDEEELKDWIKTQLRGGASPREITEGLAGLEMNPDFVKSIISREGTLQRDRVKRRAAEKKKAKKAKALAVLVCGVLGNIYLFTFSANYVAISGLFIAMVFYGLLTLFV